jgi:hypothetical protein
MKGGRAARPRTMTATLQGGRVAMRPPSKGAGEYGAWFFDSEGNLLGIGQSRP